MKDFVSTDPEGDMGDKYEVWQWLVNCCHPSLLDQNSCGRWRSLVWHSWQVWGVREHLFLRPLPSVDCVHRWPHCFCIYFDIKNWISSLPTKQVDLRREKLLLATAAVVPFWCASVRTIASTAVPHTQMCFCQSYISNTVVHFLSHWQLLVSRKSEEEKNWKLE